MQEMSKDRIEALFTTLTDVDTLLILPHNDPDPDAVAGAVALKYLLTQKTDINVHIVYQGIIGRAENKAMVSYLGSPLQLISTVNTSPPVHFALVDTQPGVGNNALPSDTPATIVIDHHPYREETGSVPFADVRLEVGSTSTILTEYLQAAQLEPEPQLATALFYGIKTDTMGLSRGAGSADAAAYFYLQPKIDADALIAIERAQVPADYFKSFDTALHTTRIYENSVVISYIGNMAYPDLTAEIADVLLRLEGSQWVVCMGVYERELIMSVRTRSRQGGAGILARTVTGAQGKAGGHGAMAGGQIPLQQKNAVQLASQIRRRILEYLNLAPDTRWQTLV